MIISDHFKPLWWHSQSFLTTLVEKDRKKCEMTKIGHFESPWWEKNGKSVK